MKKIISYFVLFVFLIPFFSAQAYYENPNIYPLGEKEAFMANTGVALSGSTGAVLFNPAGLVGIKTSKVSMSANSYLSVKTKYAPLDNVDGTDLNFTSNGVLAIPSSLVSVQKLDAWTLAFSVLVPEQTQLNDMSVYETTNFNEQIILSVRSQLVLIGLSAANHSHNGYDYGFGCFVTNYSGTQNRSVVAEPKPATGLTQTGFASDAATVEVQGLICSGGVQKDYDEKWHWGASVRLPFIRSSGSAKIFSFEQSAAGGAASSSIQNFDINYEIPMDVAGGVRYQAYDNLQLYGDASYQFAMDYKAIAAATSSVESRGTLRLNFGAAYQYSEKFKFYGGLASNPGAGVLRSAGDLKEDFTAITFGGELIQKFSTTGVGIIVANSSGESILSTGNKGGISTSVFGILLSGGFSF